MENIYDNQEISRIQRLNYITSFSIACPIEIEIKYFKKHLLGVNYFELRHYSHSHSFFELHFPLGESMHIVIGGKEITVTADGGILIFPECIHYWKDCNNASRHFSIAFIIKNEYASSDVMALRYDTDYIVYDKNEAISFVLSYVSQAMDNEYAVRIALLKSLSTILMNEIVNDLNSRSGHNIVEIGKPSRTELAKKYISANVSASLDVAMVAKQIHISERQLNRLFAKDENISVSQYIRYKLCEKAELLLHNKELTVKEIAYDLDFPSASAFSKFFKMHKGVSPHNFRIEFEQK